MNAADQNSHECVGLGDDIVFKMEVEEEVESEPVAQDDLNREQDPVRSQRHHHNDVEMLDAFTQVPAINSVDALTQTTTEHQDISMQTDEVMYANCGVQTEDAAAGKLAYELCKAVSSKGILDLLNDRQKHIFAKRITGSMEQSQNKKRKTENFDAREPQPSSSFSEKSTMIMGMEMENATIFECKGIRGQDAQDDCSFKCDKITALIKHRQEEHCYAPMASHWKVDTKALRSKDKLKCLKVRAFERKVCGKELLSQSLLVQHFTDQVHYNEVKIVTQYCVSCSTTFVNDKGCLDHAMKYMDNCGFK